MANQAQNTNQTTITSVGTATAGGTANSAKPAIVGTAQPNSTVEIFDGGRLIGIAAVDKNGNWTFAPSSSMSSGVHQFSALAIDTMGVFGPVSTPVSVSIPAPAPVVPLPPVIESVIDAVGPVQGNVPSGGTTDDNHPTISGTGIAGYKIYVYQNGLGCADTVVDSTGHWSVKVTGAMSDGLHNMTATQFPSGGAASVASNTWAITIDTTKPLPPAVPTLTNDSGTIIPPGSTTNDNHPHINGTGKAGDIITVYDGNTVLGSTKVGSNGQWTFTPGNLSAGAHSINVTETNAAGTQSEHSGSIGFIYSNVTPSPVITSVVDAVGPVQGNVPSGGTTDDPALTISGTGVAGDTVYVYLTSAGMYGGKSYGAGTAYVDASGHWSVKLDNSLQPGLNTITATQFVPGGAQSAASAGWVVTLDTFTPVKPAVPVLTDDSGATILAGSTTSDNHPHISGTGKAGDTIMVYDYYNLIGSTTIGSNGKWTFTPTSLQDNLHSFLVTEVTAAGRMSEPSDAISVRVNATVPATPVIYLTDDNGATIPANSTTADNHPHINGTGTAGTTILVMDTGKVLGSTTVGANGQWTFTPSNLNDGLHSLQVYAVNAAGTNSNFSNGIVVTVSASAPAVPATPTLTDDYGATIPAGSTTNDNHPHINGTGTAGNIIKVYDGSTVLGSTTVGSNSKWTFTPANLLAGAHSINVTETNAAGVSSLHSGSIGFTYSNVTPSPVITSVVDAVGPVQGNVPSGGTTDDTRPTISGTGIPGDTLYIYLANSSNYGGQAYGAGDTVVDASGHWSIRVNKEMPSGVNTITALQFLPGGAQSAPTAGWVVTVDTTKPATPATPTLSDDSGATIPAGSTTANNHPHINGTGKAGDIITVYDGSTVIGSTTVGSNSQWSFATGSLSTGSHGFNVTETNGAGVSSQHSGSIGFTYANGSTPPVITNMVDTVGPVQGTIPNNGVTDDSHPTVSGTGVAGSIVRIYQNGSGCGTTIVDATGHWSVKVVDTLTDGVHAIVATQFSSGQTISPISNTWTIWVETTPAQPATPTLTDDNGAAILAGSTTTDAHPNISGTGVAGNVIKVYDGSTVIGSTTVGSDGKWTFKPSSDLSNASHSISVIAVNSAGTSSSASSAVVITVRNYLPDPTIDYAWNVGTGLAIPDGGRSTSGLTGLSGTGVPGATIILYGSGVVYQKIAVVDASGHWATGAAYAAGIATSGSGTLFQFQVTQTLNGVTSGYSHTWSISSVYYAATFNPTVHADDQSQAVSVSDTDQSAPQANHHTVVGEHDAFVGKAANGNETVDLNADPASYFKESTAHIEGAKGGAIDTLHLTGDHQVLDLTSLTGKTAVAKISGIEVVDLGGQHNTLKLSLTDVLNLGENDLFQKDGKQQMMVQGKDGDTVDLSNAHIAGLADGEWAAHGTAVVGGVTYNVYEHSGAHTELLVQQGVQIVVH